MLPWQENVAKGRTLWYLGAGSFQKERKRKELHPPSRLKKKNFTHFRSRKRREIKNVFKSTKSLLVILQFTAYSYNTKSVIFRHGKLILQYHCKKNEIRTFKIDQMCAVLHLWFFTHVYKKILRYLANFNAYAISHYRHKEH